MNEKLCKHCGQPIFLSKRTDALFCSAKCGWRYRNRENAMEDKGMRPIDRRLVKNRKIIKDLFRRGKLDVSIESLELLGFDFDLYTKFVDKSYETKISVVNVYEYQIKIQGSRCQIKKLLL